MTVRELTLIEVLTEQGVTVLELREMPVTARLALLDADERVVCDIDTPDARALGEALIRWADS